MRTACTKIEDELYTAFKNFSQNQGSTINEVLANLIRGAVEGKVKLAPTGLSSRIPFCPRCGWTLSLCFDENDAYLVCLKCDFAAFIGTYHFPQKIEDWSKGKYKEVLQWV